jgi:hypothetical protein
VVRAGRQTGDEALVDPRAIREGGSEAGWGDTRGDQKSDLLPTVEQLAARRAVCHDVVRVARASRRCVKPARWSWLRRPGRAPVRDLPVTR